MSFAVVSGTAGLVILNYGVNGLCASLGALTLVLYTLVYTPMKRSSIANTWFGSVGMDETINVTSRTFKKSMEYLFSF